MLIQSVDLASVAWAQCLSDGGRVQYETCAWYYPTEDSAISSIADVWRDKPAWIAIEDQPHGVRFDSNTKAVARMQGRIIDRAKTAGVVDRVRFIPPALWQRSMGVWRHPEKCAGIALMKYDYESPNLLERFERMGGVPAHGPERQKVRTRLKKLMTDYVDAFLIGQWAAETLEKHGTLDVPSVQKYER